MSQITYRAVGHRPPLIAGLLALFAIFAVSSWQPIHGLWTSSDTYSHGYLVLGLVVWLGIRASRNPPLALGPPDALGLVALVAATGTAVAARAADVLVVQLLSLPAIFVATVWSAGGWAAAQRFVAPAAYSILAIPVWDLINEPLRATTTAVVEQLAYLTGIPTYVEGNTVHIPSGTFHVEGGCSGLHYLIVACALSAFFGLLEAQSWKRRVGLVASAATLALLANWIRVYVIILAGHLTDMQHYLVTVDHYYFGWGVFFVVLAPMLFFAHSAPSPDAAAATLPVTNARRAQPRDILVRAGTAAVLVGAVVLGISIALRPNAVAGDDLLDLPPAVGAWALRDRWNDDRLPRFVGTSAQAGGWYERGAERVGVYLGHYPVQRQGFEVVFYANRPAGANSVVAARSSISVTVPDRGKLGVAELEAIDASSTRRLVWYGYRVAGRDTSGNLAAKLLQVIGAAGRRWDADVWVVTSGCTSRDCAAARVRVEAFLQEAFPSVLVNSVIAGEATSAEEIAAMGQAR